MEKIKEKINKLDFIGCMVLYRKLIEIKKGHPMIDLIFDRMEELDGKLFDKFLDNNITVQDLI